MLEGQYIKDQASGTRNPHGKKPAPLRGILPAWDVSGGQSVGRPTRRVRPPHKPRPHVQGRAIIAREAALSTARQIFQNALRSDPERSGRLEDRCTAGLAAILQDAAKTCGAPRGMRPQLLFTASSAAIREVPFLYRKDVAGLDGDITRVTNPPGHILDFCIITPRLDAGNA